MFSISTASIVLAAGMSLHAADDTAPSEPTSADIEFFERSVRPILAEHCYQCHGPKKQKGGLRLDSRAAVLKGGDTGPALVVGKPAESEMIAAINYEADGYQMPPTGKLEPQAIAALTKWVTIGAPWPGDAVGGGANASKQFQLGERLAHWSLQPVQRPELPALADTSWPLNSIDLFILSKLAAAGLQPAPAADRRTLLRRVTFDLTGLPPTVEEIAAFLNDDSPDAYERVVERLLASPRYGERWARHWLDLVRFAETGGHEFDFPIEHATPYRDYVIRVFNDDVPYDQFVKEHIAGDLLPSRRLHPVSRQNESVVGTAFFWFGQGKHSPVDTRAEECDTVDNQIDVMTKTFLGLTVACARCHDHKFDAISTQDYYALAGFLQSSRRQYAFVDDPTQTNAIRSKLTELRDGIKSAVFAGIGKLLSAPVGDWTAQATDKTNKRVAADLTHPLHAWSVLSQATSTAEFQQRKGQLISAWNKHAAAATSFLQRGDVFAEFDGDTFGSWFVTGQAWGAGPATNVVPLVHQTAQTHKQQLAGPGVAHSGLVSGRLRGVLRSPTFKISRKYVYYRMARFGGRNNAGRANKNGQAHLIVHGFQYIKNPLYGSLSINVTNDGRFRWYRHDVSKFPGENAYLELVDEDDGYLVVDRIVFSDGEPPPETANPLIVDMLRQADVTSQETLGQAYHNLVRDAVLDCSSSDRPTSPAHADAAEFLRLALEGQASPAQTQAAPVGKTAEEIPSVIRGYQRLESQLQEPQQVLAIADGTGENEHVLIRGNHKKPGRVVPRRFLAAFSDPSKPVTVEGSGRLLLAQQMADPDNPLVARVIVNRLWLHHFGRGIVPTPDNFGVLGSPPSHPQLLDELALELIRAGWSIKHMQRVLVTSQTYRMSSQTNPELETRDPENRLWHRMPVKRLEGEAIRDAILAISGRLNGQMYGDSVPPHLTPFMEGRGRPAQSGPLDGDGRRSIYINVRRNFLTPMFLAFDYPTPFSTIGRRSTSNVPAQALTMMNNPFVVQQAAVWAGSLQAVGHDNRDKAIGRLYETAFGRPPTERELSSAAAFLNHQSHTSGTDESQAWADLCHVLMNVKEFIFIR